MLETNLTNQFLIAMPGLADPNFHQTVTYIFAHNEDGAMGLVLNRPTPIDLHDIFSQMKLNPVDEDIGQQVIHQGGPVQIDRGFVIHPADNQWESSLHVSDELGITTSKDILESMANGQGPKESFIALGYAGWGAGQIEKEIGENAWLNGPCDSGIIFSTPIRKRWATAASLIGVDLLNISDQVGHA